MTDTTQRAREATETAAAMMIAEVTGTGRRNEVLFARLTGDKTHDLNLIADLAVVQNAWIQTLLEKLDDDPLAFIEAIARGGR